MEAMNNSTETWHQYDGMNGGRDISKHFIWIVTAALKIYRGLLQLCYFYNNRHWSTKVVLHVLRQ